MRTNGNEMHHRTSEMADMRRGEGYTRLNSPSPSSARRWSAGRRIRSGGHWRAFGILSQFQGPKRTLQ